MPVENNSRNRILERTRDALKTKCPHKGCAKTMFIYELVDHDKACEHKVRHDRLWLNRPYVGQWKNGKPHGQGKYTYENGDVYEGEWNYGVRNGQGKMSYNNGNVYEGEWKNGVRNGQGKMSYNSGNVYEGEWKNGVKDGQGKQGLWEGKWKDGEWYKYWSEDHSFCRKRSSAPLQTTLDRPNTAKRQRT